MDRNGRRAYVDLQAAGGVEPARLERSRGLRVRRVSRGGYEVGGGKEPHYGDLYTRRMPRCDCGDHIWRARVCRHILAAMLREGDERVIAPGDLRPHPRMLGQGDGKLTAGPLAGVEVPLIELRRDYFAAMRWDPETGHLARARAEELGIDTLLEGYLA